MSKSIVGFAAAIVLSLATISCGDDGGSNGMDGPNGAGNTSGSGGACAQLCDSPCANDVGSVSANDFDQCVAGCQQAGFDQCGDELSAFLSCLEANGCDTNDAGINCLNQATSFAACIQ